MMLLELDRLAGPGDGEDHVLARDHAEIAVARLGRMHEEGRRAGRGEGGGDLLADVAALADAGDDDAAARSLEDADTAWRNGSAMPLPSAAFSAISPSVSSSSVRRAELSIALASVLPPTMTLSLRMSDSGWIADCVANPARRRQTLPAAPQPVFNHGRPSFDRQAGTAFPHSISARRSASWHAGRAWRRASAGRGASLLAVLLALPSHARRRPAAIS